jgi:hypothetical protein
MQPLPSKKLLIVLGAGIIMGLSVMAFLILTYLLDGTLSNLSRAENITGLKVASVIPQKGTMVEKYPTILTQLINQLITRATTHNTNGLILCFSAFDGEGKHHTSKLLYKQMLKRGFKVALISTNESKTEDPNIYHIPEIQMDQIHNSEIMDQYDYKIVNLPSHVDGVVPVKLIEMAGKAFMIVRADRTWNNANQKALDQLKEHRTIQHSELIINGLKFHELDQVLGELPVKRSKMEQWFRRIAKFQFRSQFNLF